MIAYVIYDVDGKKLELSRDFETNCLRMGVGEESCYIPYDELKQLASFINQIAIELDEHKKVSSADAIELVTADRACTESKGEPFPETIGLSDVPPAIKGGANG